MEQYNKNNNGGIGFFGLIQIVFIVLKLCHVINWNWFFILIPSIVYVALIVFVFIILLLYGLFD